MEHMNVSAPTADQRALFGAVLQPHRSLSPRGFRVLIAAICITFFAVGLGFLLVGAWPVLGFCGLEVALIYALFRLNFRSLARYETIRLTDSELELRRIAPDGAIERITFQPYWLRVTVEEKPGRASRLILSSHGRAVTVGAFLAPDERVALAEALTQALARQHAGRSAPEETDATA